MKPAWNKITLPALILLIPFMLQAQHRPQGNFRLGFTGSPTFGHLDFESGGANYTSGSMKSAFSYGIIGDFGFAENYYFGSGFILATMAGEANVPAGGSTIESITYKIQYIEIPLTLKLKTDPGQLGRFYAQFGPDLGVKVSTKHTFTNLVVRDDAELIRLGLLAGGGVEWKLKTSDLLTGLSYNKPFTEVFRNPGAKNPVITLNLGIFF